MNILAPILIFLLLPVQFFPVSFLVDPPDSRIASQAEGISDKKEIQKPFFEKNFRGSLVESEKENDAVFQGSGFVPQRKKNFYETKVWAGSSVVIDADTGTILHYDKGRQRIPIASLTKMMTAVVVMEQVENMDEPVIIDEEAVFVEGTKIGCPRSGYCFDDRLHVGEKVTVKDLMMAMLMNSTNDAAIALAKHISGSQKEFAKLMNQKAEDLNLADSKFCNPSGLDEDDCYSSAYDIARVTAYSMKYDFIWKVMKKKEIEIRSCDGKYSHLIKNTDLLLDQMPNCLGGKTGFTYNAGLSLMMAAEHPIKGKHRIVAVILNDNQRWEDMRNLIEWTFSNYEWR